MHEIIYLLIVCTVHASNVNKLRNRIDKYIVKAGYT